MHLTYPKLYISLRRNFQNGKKYLWLPDWIDRRTPRLQALAVQAGFEMPEVCLGSDPKDQHPQLTVQGKDLTGSALLFTTSVLPKVKQKSECAVDGREAQHLRVLSVCTHKKNVCKMLIKYTSRLTKVFQISQATHIRMSPESLTTSKTSVAVLYALRIYIWNSFNAFYYSYFVQKWLQY